MGAEAQFIPLPDAEELDASDEMDVGPRGSAAVRDGRAGIRGERRARLRAGGGGCRYRPGWLGARGAVCGWIDVLTGVAKCSFDGCWRSVLGLAAGYAQDGPPGRGRGPFGPPPEFGGGGRGARFLGAEAGRPRPRG